MLAIIGVSVGMEVTWAPLIICTPPPPGLAASECEAVINCDRLVMFWWLDESDVFLSDAGGVDMKVDVLVGGIESTVMVLIGGS